MTILLASIILLLIVISAVLIGYTMGRESRKAWRPMRTTTLTVGPTHPDNWWAERQQAGQCTSCGGQCDGADCGLHAAGCVFGGPVGGSYWLIAEDCPSFHGGRP